MYQRNDGILTLLQASASLSKLYVFMGKYGFLYKLHEMRRLGHESAHLKQGKKELTAGVERVMHTAIFSSRTDLDLLGEVACFRCAFFRSPRKHMILVLQLHQ